MILAQTRRANQFVFCLVLSAKIFRFALTPNQIYIHHRPVPQRGVAQRQRRGAGCGGRGRCCRRAAQTRTEKSCGPDAPTLASSWRKQFRRRRWQTSPVAGESTKETVKTIARGMPGVSGVTVVTNARVYYHYTRGCGRLGRPAFPAPSVERAGSFRHNPRESRRGIEKVCL